MMKRIPNRMEKAVMDSEKRKRENQRGNAILEFAMVSIVLFPLLLGVVSLGVNLGHTTQTIQICRDAGHMYAKGVDFSQSGNQQVIVDIASPMGITSATAGTGVVILSQIMQVYQDECTAAGVTSCSNLGSNVVINRIVIGNSTYTSHYATPNPSLIDSSGNIGTGTNTTNGYLNDSSVVVANLGTTLSEGQIVYLSEAYFSTPDVSYLGGPASGGVYATTFF